MSTGTPSRARRARRTVGQLLAIAIPAPLGHALNEVSDPHGLYTVTLDSRGNPDFGQNPTRRMPGVPKMITTVTSLRLASDACRAYIRLFELGGGNWHGGKVTYKGKHYANISYNGRAWTPGKYPAPEIPLETVLP